MQHDNKVCHRGRTQPSTLIRTGIIFSQKVVVLCCWGVKAGWLIYL